MGGNLQRFTHVNPALVQLSGYSLEELHQRYLDHLLESSSSKDANNQPRMHLLTEAGQQVPVEVMLQPLDPEIPDWHLAEVRDLSQQMALEQHLQHLITTDVLTGALTRHALQDKARIELERTSRNGHPLCLAMLDIDNFKPITDFHGHAAGDQILQQLSQFCRTRARMTDVFARLGSEEFVFLLPDTSESAASAFLTRMGQTLEALPVAVEHGKVHLDLNIGISRYTPGDSLESLLSRANDDLHMNRAIRQAEKDKLPGVQGMQMDRQRINH